MMQTSFFGRIQLANFASTKKKSEATDAEQAKTKKVLKPKKVDKKSSSEKVVSKEDKVPAKKSSKSKSKVEASKAEAGAAATEGQPVIE